MAKLKDSGKRRKFATGSVRDVDDGKGRYDLLPVHANFEMAVHFQDGCRKYGHRNWEKGQPLSDYVSSAKRHLDWHLAGYTDERHDRAAAWNVLCLLETQHRIRAGELPAFLDDLPKRKSPTVSPPSCNKKEKQK